MKKNSFLLAAFFLLSVLSSFQPLMAQEKTKDEKDKELKIQEEIDQQKKALIEQKKAQEEIQKALELSHKELDSAMLEVKTKIPYARSYSGTSRAFSNQRGTRPDPFDQLYFYSDPSKAFSGPFPGDGERSSWDFSKSVKESTFSRNYIFDVEKTAKTVVMSITGECKSGDIRIKILTPGGKTYSDILIDESGNLNWRKSFNISEDENKDKSGEWKYEISTSGATGFFKISLQTF